MAIIQVQVGKNFIDDMLIDGVLELLSLLRT
jgi:hypothetical protein